MSEEVSDALHKRVKLEETTPTDFQVAIINGYGRDVFFTARVGKCGSSGTFQQGIPQNFARHHPELNGKYVTLENVRGGKWVVLVLPTQIVLRFSKGWRAFSRENNLRDGDQLLFRKIGKLHFKVIVFDCRGNFLAQPANAVEALPPTRTVYDFRGKALADPPHVKAEPPSLTAMPLQPLTVAVKPEYPLTQPVAALESNLANIMLRHFLPPPLSGQLPDYHITAAATDVPLPIPAAIVDGTRDVYPKEEQHEMEVAEGKEYIFLDSDEDDDRKVATMTMPKSLPTIVGRQGSKVGMHCTREQLCGDRMHFPSENQDGSTPEIEEPESDETPLTRLPRSISRRKDEKHHEVGQCSHTHPIHAQKEDDDDDGEAIRLLRHQGRKSFSNIVCTHRVPDFVSGTDKSRALDTAIEFSSRLKKPKFVAVMCAAQVYHSFYQPVPAEILEATGTHGAKVVETWLTDKDSKMYRVNWAWSGFWKTPMLNNDGWAKFALDHFLEEGDVCVFEVVNFPSAFTRAGLLLHVHIFRVEEAHRDSYRIALGNTFSA